MQKMAVQRKHLPPFQAQAANIFVKAGDPMEEMEVYDLKPVRKVFSRVGWSLCAIIAALLLVQVPLVLLLDVFWPDGCWLTDSSTGTWLLTFVPLYLVAIPVGMLFLRRIPAQPPQPASMGAKNFWIFLPICFFLTYSGNIVGNLLSSLISGGDAQNALDQYVMDTNPLKILFTVILAPLFEEYVFRKQLIDRTRVYGEQIAVLLSALTFGLFHMNLFQFFYAFLVGWVFAYIYTRTGKLRYPVILHSIMNFMGSIVAPFILSLLDLEALSNIDPNATDEELMAVYATMLPGLLLYFAYLIVLLGMSVAGLVLLIRQCRRLKWLPGEAQLPQRTHIKTVYLNAGMLVFLILSLAMTVISVLP